MSGGSGNGATANITTNADGRVSTIVLVDKGTGYKLGDILTVPDVALSKSGSAHQRVVVLLQILKMFKLE